MTGAGVAGGGDQGGQVEGDQVGQGQEQPGDFGVGAGGQVGEVEQPGAAGVVAVRGRRARAGGRTGRRPKPASVRTSATPVRLSGVAVPASGFGDLGWRVCPARRNSMIFPGRRSSPAPGSARGVGLSEEPGLPGAEVPHRRPQCRGEYPARAAAASIGQPFTGSRAGLVAAVVRPGGPGEELPAAGPPRPDGGRFRCMTYATTSQALTTEVKTLLKSSYMAVITAYLVA